MLTNNVPGSLTAVTALDWGPRQPDSAPHQLLHSELHVLRVSAND